MKLVLIGVDTPCGGVLAYMWVYFVAMGYRFQDHLKLADNTYKSKLGKLVITFVAIASFCQTIFTGVYFVYPTVKQFQNEQCSQSYLYFERFQIYYTVSTQPMQGIFMMFVIGFISEKAM